MPPYQGFSISSHYYGDSNSSYSSSGSIGGGAMNATMTNRGYGAHRGVGGGNVSTNNRSLSSAYPVFSQTSSVVTGPAVLTPALSVATGPAIFSPSLVATEPSPPPPPPPPPQQAPRHQDASTATQQPVTVADGAVIESGGGTETYQYVTIDDNRIVPGQATRDIFSRAPVPIRRRGGGCGGASTSSRTMNRSRTLSTTGRKSAMTSNPNLGVLNNSNANTNNRNPSFFRRSQTTQSHINTAKSRWNHHLHSRKQQQSSNNSNTSKFQRGARRGCGPLIRRHNHNHQHQVNHHYCKNTPSLSYSPYDLSYESGGGDDYTDNGSDSEIENNTKNNGDIIMNHSQFVVLSQRDVIVGPNPLLAQIIHSATAGGAVTASPSMSSLPPGFSSSLQYHQEDGTQCVGARTVSMNGIMDIFTNLCICPANDQNRNNNFNNITSTIVAGGRMQHDHDSLDPFLNQDLGHKIVYPVVRYPARLNNSEMVQQRRRSLQDHLMFRPVTVE